MSNFKTILVSLSIGVVLGAVYNTTLYGPWAEDLSTLKNAYYGCENKREYIAKKKDIDPKRFNTCTIFFYYDVTESDNTGRYLHASSVDNMHAMWIGDLKNAAEQEKVNEQYRKDRAAEDARAAIPYVPEK